MKNDQMLERLKEMIGDICLVKISHTGDKQHSFLTIIRKDNHKGCSFKLTEWTDENYPGRDAN